MADEHLYHGDNLDVLRRKIRDETADLCHIDPPFKSKRHYFQIYDDHGREDRAQAQALVNSPTKAMRAEIVAAGKYRHPCQNREDDRLQVITIDDILAGKRLDLPMARTDAVKSARAEGDADRRIDLL